MVFCVWEIKNGGELAVLVHAAAGPHVEDRRSTRGAVDVLDLEAEHVGAAHVLRKVGVHGLAVGVVAEDVLPLLNRQLFGRLDQHPMPADDVAVVAVALLGTELKGIELPNDQEIVVPRPLGLGPVRPMRDNGRHHRLRTARLERDAVDLELELIVPRLDVVVPVEERRRPQPEV